MKTNKSIVGWSVLAAYFFFLFWDFYDLALGPVPVIATVKISQDWDYVLPYGGISRWWDILFGSVWLALFLLACRKLSSVKQARNPGSGLGFCLIFSSAFALVPYFVFGLAGGLIAGLAGGITAGLIVGVGTGLTVFHDEDRLMAPTSLGVTFCLLIGLYCGVLQGLGFGLAFSLAVILAVLPGFVLSVVIRIVWVVCLMIPEAFVWLSSRGDDEPAGGR
ncbi:MAG: hypothetical protein PHS62_04550 [Patescibacteria group bacterium]|nr:hypothetical protein [Patescibacteria group bacterium]